MPLRDIGLMQSVSEKTVTLSPIAIQRVKDFMSKDKSMKANGLRIFVMAGGCSGYQYGMVLEKEAKSDDIYWSESGINVYVDKQSAKMIQGSKIDFVETVQGSGFKIDNPNAVSSCGCGNSFETEGSGHEHPHGEAEADSCGCGCGCE
jgi:iron-sulfur cluster assembly accessory protein